MLWAAESGSLRFGTDRAKAERLINNELQANWLFACAELSAQGLDALAQAQVRGIVPSAAGVLCHTGDLNPCDTVSMRCVYVSVSTAEM